MAIGVLAAAGAATLVPACTAPLAYPARPLLFLPIALAAAAWHFFGTVRTSETWRERKVRREDARQLTLHLVLLTGCAFFSLPYVWMVLTSLKPDEMIFKNPTSLPDPVVWKNYPRTFQFLELALGHIRTSFGGLFVMNTLEVTFLSLTAMVLSSSMVAYAFARLRWPGRDILFAVLLGTMMLPGAVTMIPRFLIFKELGWVDTLLPLWVPSLFANAFDVFLLRQFFLTIPTDLEDAARIDGCNPFTIYWRILMPLIRPALAAVAILHFLGAWNDFMGPLIYISSPERMTGSYALRLFQSAGSGEWAMLLAAATLWTLPVVLLFFFAQRAFIEGIALTGMKN
ncbi:MAG: carbohydrate ABC transporter permease [Armatimonadetes bacterium]|nr:carbohydrate ABC transporter permease [Armatimonadota bacterium]